MSLFDLRAPRPWHAIVGDRFMYPFLPGHWPVEVVELDAATALAMTDGELQSAVATEIVRRFPCAEDYIE